MDAPAPLTHAVFGHPVAHSLSPRIHAAFGRQCGIALRYGAVDAAPAVFAAALAAFAAAGGRGANVTLPHKPAALALCATVSDRARAAGAVNTLLRTPDGWHGDTTDGSGLLRDLARQGVALSGARVLLLGAGGAARGIAAPLLASGIQALVVSNRTRAGADALVLALDDARAGAMDAAALVTAGAFDVVIHATAAARAGALPDWPASLVHAGTTGVDLGYGAAAAPFGAWARAASAGACIDGLGMLVEQAAESFALWHGTWPDAQAVLDALRAQAATG